MNCHGRKLLLKGNHDYWWSTVTSMRKYLKENDFEKIDFIYNNAYEFENCVIVGARGWNQTSEPSEQKFIKREVARLELSIQDGIQKFGEEKEKIAFMHYPPITQANLARQEMSEFVKTLKKYDIKKCFYGHLHSTSIKEAVEGNYFGIDFKLVSADGLDFKLYRIK